MQPEPTLRALRDRPFELLLLLEKRARDVAAGQREGGAAQEWIGVAFRMGGETFLVERDEAREVMGVPAPITRVPGARAWILGLANDPETRKIPVIMVSSKGQETDRIWGMRQGAVDYLVKPVTPAQLVEKAQAALLAG